MQQRESHFDLNPHHVGVLLSLRASILVLEILVQKGATVRHAANKHLLGQEIEPSAVHGKSLTLDIYLVCLGRPAQPDGYIFVAPICRIYSSQERNILVTHRSSDASYTRLITTQFHVLLRTVSLMTLPSGSTWPWSTLLTMFVIASPGAIEKPPVAKFCGTTGCPCN